VFFILKVRNCDIKCEYVYVNENSTDRSK